MTYMHAVVHVMPFVERIGHMVVVLPIQFLLLMMGMNNATSTYSCLWCTVRSSERYVYM